MMYEVCMKYKCKTCPLIIKCEEKEQKQERLTYKPFENLPKILAEKGIKIW